MIASVTEAKLHHSNINAHFLPTEKPWLTLHLKGEEMALHLSPLWLCICPFTCSLLWALWTGALAARGGAQRDLELLGFPQRGVTNLRWQDESRSISQNLSSAALTGTRGGINKKKQTLVDRYTASIKPGSRSNLVLPCWLSNWNTVASSSLEISEDAAFNAFSHFLLG